MNIFNVFFLHSLLHLLVNWAWWDWPLTWLTNHRPSVPWHCWLGRLTSKKVLKMTYNVSSGTLNPTIPYHINGLQMSSWPGTVIPRCRTSSSSRVGVSKTSVFRFVSRTACSPYTTLSLRWLSISSRRCTDLEQSSAAYHICSVTSRLLLSFEDILLWTLLPVITVVVPAKWHCHLWTC